MASQRIAHTTVEQVYQHVGNSRTFFYSFIKSKEDLNIEALYLQQPNIVAYLNELMNDSNLSWREAVPRFLTTCCYGEQNGIIILTLEEQQVYLNIYRTKVTNAFEPNNALCFNKYYHA